MEQFGGVPPYVVNCGYISEKNPLCSMDTMDTSSGMRLMAHQTLIKTPLCRCSGSGNLILSLSLSHKGADASLTHGVG